MLYAVITSPNIIIHTPTPIWAKEAGTQISFRYSSDGFLAPPSNEKS